MSLQSPPLASLQLWLDRFAPCRLVVWGDLVADRFLLGSTTRVSREAPALVLRHEQEDVRPGGAGNAALNAAHLGAQVTVAGFLGDDRRGQQLRSRLEAAGIDTSALVTRRDGRSPVKTRVMAGGLHTVRQQILRIDDDRPWPADPTALATLLERLQGALASADALLISDYGIGSVSPQQYAALRPQLDDRIPVTLDSRHRILEFPGAWAATPNEGEVEKALSIELNGEHDTIVRAGDKLRRQLEVRHLLITRGSCGMAVFTGDSEPAHLDIYGTTEIADVTGAGDTVIATLTLALAAGADILDAARLANTAAGLAVLKHGTAPVTRQELLAALQQGEA